METMRGKEIRGKTTQDYSIDQNEAVLNSQLVSFTLLDNELVIKAFNPKADTVFKQFTGKQLSVGTRLSSYLDDEKFDQFCEQIQAVLNGKQFTFELVTISPDEGNDWFELACEVVFDKQTNEQTGFILWTIPISDGKIDQQRIQRLYEAEREQRQMAEALQEASLGLGFTLDTDIILDRILEQVSKVVPTDLGRVIMFENRIARVVRVRGTGEFDSPEYQKQNGITFDIDETSNLRWIIENDQPLVIPDTKLYSGWKPQPGLEFIRSWIGIPIHAYGELIGVFSLSKAQEGVYHSGHIKQLAAFSGQVGLALQNARLFSAVQRRAKEAEMLRQAAAAVTTELDLDHVLDRILINLKKVVQFDNAAIFLLEEDLLRVVAVSSTSNEIKIDETYSANNALFRESLTTGRPIILSDASKEEKFLQWVEGTTAHGWLGVPLHLRGRAIGFLTIESRQVNAYSVTEATLAQAFANQATIALENARLFEELQSLATIDPLTEIWNRRHLIYLSKLEFQRAKRYKLPLSVILFDIDSFKNVNDTYGHPVGDQVLRCMAMVCKGNLRQVDLLGRYGGEEFMAVLPNTSIDRAKIIAERLRKQIAQTPMQTDRGEIYISASFGIAEMDESCLDIDTLLTYADRAAISAKIEGKNRVSFPDYGDEPNI